MPVIVGFENIFSVCNLVLYACLLYTPVKLKEVILNLLRNAADAVDNRSTDKRVHLFAACDISSGQILLKIQDSGCGIPKEHLSDIFTPFVTYKQGGTGLGLAITDRIVTAHHGKISVESMPCLLYTSFTKSTFFPAR